jgi:MFS family permease
MKLLRTVVTIFLFTRLSEIPTGSTLVVWSVDGELDYFGVAHTFLLAAAIAVVIFLWLPYTLSLLFLQQLQKISNSCWCLKWVNKLSPFYDAHFVPFKSKHRYWFGLMLLTRGILLVLFASTVTVHQSVYLLIILVFGIALLLYNIMAIMHPFKSSVVLVIQSSSLANLVLLSGFLLYAQTQNKNEQILRTTAAGISIGVVFIHFCGIALFNVIKLCRHIWSIKRGVSGKHNEDREMNEVNDDFLIEYHDSREIIESQ